ncbi:MAG: DUF1499 domain-containing protein [Saprospiraceae bacterium]
MKYLFSIIILISMSWTTDSNFSFFEKTKLEPCPNSPNCVSTQETRRRKRMRPIILKHTSAYAKKKMKLMLNDEDDFSNVTLIEEGEKYLHYEFKTKIGKFIDDVEFIFDEKNKQIHFRSASRKGYGDFGKNKRRMKKIRKKYEQSTITWTPKF